MKTLPAISTQIDEKIINRVIQKKFALLSSYYFYFMSNWTYLGLFIIVLSGLYISRREYYLAISKK